MPSWTPPTLTFQYSFEIRARQLLPPFHNVVPIDFCESQTLPTLTKYIDKIIYIYNTKHVYSKNITHDVSNDVHLIF